MVSDTELFVLHNSCSDQRMLDVRDCRGPDGDCADEYPRKLLLSGLPSFVNAL